MCLPAFTVFLKYRMYISLVLHGNIADISLNGLGYYIKQTMLSNSLKWYTDHFERGQNWIFLKCDIWTDYVWQRESEGKRAVHKSFFDIAASLPQTHFLPASLCLSSKLHNLCQSCLDCRLKVIHKQGKIENERGWKEGEGGEGRTIIPSV